MPQEAHVLEDRLLEATVGVPEAAASPGGRARVLHFRSTGRAQAPCPNSYRSARLGHKAFLIHERRWNDLVHELVDEAEELLNRGSET